MQRSELGHRLLELKTGIMGRMAPRILSYKTSGVDGLAKKLAAKTPAAEPDTSLESELLHPEDVPEIVMRTPPMKPATTPTESPGEA
ncbi:MAG: hypothetical protein AAF962_09850 [Actinomycetota bacterium]